MKKKQILFTMLLFATLISYSQSCDCLTHFEWVKKTFEENDAGFEYAKQTKGEQAYLAHNEKILNKVKSAETTNDCAAVMFEWLTFFRSGHIAIRLNEPFRQRPAMTDVSDNFDDWETYDIDENEFLNYLNSKTEHDYEGVWETSAYIIGIKKHNEGYVGSIIQSEAETWSKNQIKLTFSIDVDMARSVFYMYDHSAVNSDQVLLMGYNHLQIGNVTLKRIYPKLDDEQKFRDYFKLVDAKEPYFERLNETTNYFRIPSFESIHKKSIDSIISIHREEILNTQNLIIDIRNGTGGSDASFYELLPFLYTNPIRTVGVEMLSTNLNNQRMLNFLENADEYGMDEEDRKWVKEAYEKLEKNKGRFVSLNKTPVSITQYDTVYRYPKNIGIIINQRNGSTDEQFLLAAKQSKKVKLFGTTTKGILDVSNMHFVNSPCDEFQLGYSLSKSLRIPEFTIDEKGIQPDFYLDKTIPVYDWVDYVNEVLNH